VSCRGAFQARSVATGGIQRIGEKNVFIAGLARRRDGSAVARRDQPLTCRSAPGSAFLRELYGRVQRLPTPRAEPIPFRCARGSASRSTPTCLAHMTMICEEADHDPRRGGGWRYRVTSPATTRRACQRESCCARAGNGRRRRGQRRPLRGHYALRAMAAEPAPPSRRCGGYTSEAAMRTMQRLGSDDSVTPPGTARVIEFVKGLKHFIAEAG